MKCIKIDLPMEFQSIEIEPLYDLHIGSKKCDYQLIQKRIDRIKNNSNVFCILGGDIINNSTISSVAAGDVYEEPLTPMKQMEVAVRMLAPIKNKVLGVVSGNHERRNKEGLDITQWMCAQLDLLDRYDPASAVLFVRFGKNEFGRKQPYSIYITHGSGGGGMVGSKANKLSRTGAIVDADIVVVGHTHQALTFRESSYKVNYSNNCVVPFEQVFVNASAMIDYEQYAEFNGLKPQSKLCPVIRLNGYKKSIVVNM